MKKKTAALCMLLAAGMIAGCGSQSAVDTSMSAEAPEEMVTTASSSVPEETPTPTEEAISAVSVEPDNGLADGQMYSYLTGEPVSTDVGNLRPFAVMINNLDAALPQSGIGSADIIYEAEVEGSITRMMAVFQDPTSLPKIGPVRSSRHYYIYMADDSEAIYTHFGWSPQAQAIIEGQGLEHINGMTDKSGAFFRTSDRVAPHNAYVDGSRLPELAQAAGYSLTHSSEYQPNLAFNTENTDLTEGEDAQVIHIGFSYDNPVLTYHSDDGLYYRSEYGGEQIDAETGNQLCFKNVIIQQVTKAILEDGEHLELGMFGTGTGYYATNGKIIPITWKKDSQQDKTIYYDASGNQLKLNPGKTMIEVINQDYTNTWGAE